MVPAEAEATLLRRRGPTGRLPASVLAACSLPPRCTTAKLLRNPDMTVSPRLVTLALFTVIHSQTGGT